MRCRSRTRRTPGGRSIRERGTITRSIAAREPRSRNRDAGTRRCAARRCSRWRSRTSARRTPRAEAKRLMREVLDHYLERRTIVSRRVVRDLQAIGDEETTARMNAMKQLSPHAMIELGVNIDHVATLRQARRTHEPDPALGGRRGAPGRRRRHHGAPARGSPAHPGRGRAAPARARAHQAQPRDGGNRRDGRRSPAR